MEKFVILLNRDTNRVKHVNDHVKIMLPDIQIFDAVDGKTNKIEEILDTEEFKLTDEYKNKCTRGQLGCSLSHLTLWKKIVDEEISEAIIFEDDVEIPEDFEVQFSEMHKETPEDYDFLYLFVHPIQYKQNLGNKSIIIPDKKYIVKGYKTYGMVGYCISNEGAKKLLEMFSIIQENVDTQLSNDLDKLKVFAVKNPLVSTIGQLTSAYDNSKLRSNIWKTKKFV